MSRLFLKQLQCLAVWTGLHILSASLADGAVKLAVVADPTFSKEADLLTVELSKNKDVELLEREQIDKVLTERGINKAGLTQDTGLQIGKILGADGILVLRPIAGNAGSIGNASLIGVTSSAIFYSFNFNPNERKWGNWIMLEVPIITERSDRIKKTAGSQTKISVLPFRTLRYGESYEILLQKIIANTLAAQEPLLVLERESLDLVASEKALHPDPAGYWAGEYSVTATIEQDREAGPGQYLLTLELQSSEAKEPTYHKIKGGKDDIPTMGSEAVRWIMQEVKVKPKTGENELTLVPERKKLLQQALWIAHGEKGESAWQSAHAAWILNERDPALAELLLNLAFRENDLKNGGPGSIYPIWGPDSYESICSKMLTLVYDFDLNFEYFRDFPKIQFPEYLGRLDEMWEWHEIFREAAEKNPSVKKSYDQGQTDIVMAYALCLPQILVLVDPERETYQPRTDELRARTEEMFARIEARPLTENRRGMITVLQTAMIPIWSRDGNEMKSQLIQLLEKNGTEDWSQERIQLQAGMYLAYLIGLRFREASNIPETYQNWAQELTTSPKPQDRMLGRFIQIYRNPYAPRNPILDEERRQCLAGIYRELDSEAFFKLALENPSFLPEETYTVTEGALRTLNYFLNKDDLSGNLKGQARNLSDDKSEEIQQVLFTQELQAQTARKFLLYFLKHWPEGVKKAPATNFNQSYKSNGITVPLRPELFDQQYSPILNYLSTYQPESDTVPERKKYVTKVLAWMSDPNLNLLGIMEKYGLKKNNQENISLAKETVFSLKPFWQLQEALGTALGKEPKSCSLVSVKDGPDGLRLLARESESGWWLGLLSRSSAKQEFKAIPKGIFPPDANYQIVAETGSFVVLGCVQQPFVTYTKLSGEWKNTGIVQTGKIRGFSGKGDQLILLTEQELIAFNEATQKWSVPISIGRKPAQGPLDDETIQSLSLLAAPDTEGEFLFIQGRSNDGSHITVYRCNPVTMEFTRDDNAPLRFQEWRNEQRQMSAQGKRPFFREPVSIRQGPVLMGKYEYSMESRLQTKIQAKLPQPTDLDPMARRLIHSFPLELLDGAGKKVFPLPDFPKLLNGEKQLLCIDVERGIIWSVTTDQLDEFVSKSETKESP